jgi:hypothetical protein
VIVVFGCDFLSSGSVPFSRELDALFRSEVPKASSLIGRAEHLARRGLTIRYRILRTPAGFGADVGARFARCIRAAIGLREPQATRDEQRRHCYRNMFRFHWFLILEVKLHAHFFADR